MGLVIQLSKGGKFRRLRDFSMYHGVKIVNDHLNSATISGVPTKTQIFVAQHKPAAEALLRTE
jgi:hypothetical protein